MSIRIENTNLGNKKEAVNKAPVAPVVEAPVAPVAEETAPVMENENMEYGTARLDLSFVCSLGDPSNPDTTNVKLPDGSEQPKVTHTIVGYKFQLNKDMKYPECGTTEAFKSNPMDYKEINWVEGKAGDIIKLTPFETALMLSQPQFNGGCDGGEKPVFCVYQKKALTSKAGKLATASAASAVPRVSLRAATGSIKDLQIEPVLSFEVQEVGGFKKKIRTILPGFEKWSPLASNAKKKNVGGGKESTDPKKVANKNAQAFLAFVQSRK